MNHATRHTIPLPGCTPEPLMNYLKALGILRIVAQQKDPTATGLWKSGIFTLTSTLDEQGISAFFLNEYAPSPIMGPWAARSGFFKGTSEQAARGDAKTRRKTLRLKRVTLLKRRISPGNTEAGTGPRWLRSITRPNRHCHRRIDRLE